MPHLVDVHVGKNLKKLRHLRSLTQASVATELGVSFQQVQKYETGYNRVSASRLYELAQLLETNTAYFFSGLPGENERNIPEIDMKSLHLAHSIAKIPNPRIRQHIDAFLSELSK